MRLAIFDTANLTKTNTPDTPERAAGFVPTEWYPTALATRGSDLWIATAKGQGTGPNNGDSLIPAVRRPFANIPTFQRSYTGRWLE